MKTAFATALLLALTAGSAHAQKVTPGLWEYSITMKSQDGRMDAAMAKMQEELARMPPDQRKMMEQMMASRGVGGVGAGPGRAITTQVCVTPEQAARDEMPQHDGNCRQVSKERSGKTMRYKFTCTGEHPGSGEGETTFVNDREHKGHVVMNTTVQGKPERMEIDSGGRWLGADCGNVKPRK